MSTRYGPSLAVPVDRWGFTRLDNGGDPDEGTAWARTSITAPDAPTAEQRVLAVIDYDYEDDLSGAIATAEPDGSRWTVTVRFPPPGGRGWPDEARDQNPPPPADDEPGAWQRYNAWTELGGKIRARCETNDNLDRGYPSEYASWELTWPSLAVFLRHVGGGSHQGVGCTVTVTVDGVEYRNGQPVDPGQKATT
jgi:hypothetical protein